MGHFQVDSNPFFVWVWVWVLEMEPWLVSARHEACTPPLSYTSGPKELLTGAHRPMCARRAAPQPFTPFSGHWEGEGVAFN
jgi:hypothetical protein